jgi:dTDP-4-amino-4,6-dideoxygalactose transaminase
VTIAKLKTVTVPEMAPFMDLAALHAPIQKEIEQEVARVVASSSFVLGPAVETFENNFADYCEAEYCVGCNSGTSAIHMALCALNIGPGDEVITVSHTFVGTVWGILYCGARPVFVDIDPHTMNMDVGQIENVITEQTKAILPVHLYGQPVDMDSVRDIASRYGLYVIEDAAQAHGARLNGRRVGSFGDLACFSFYPGKNLGAWGEAGAVVTSNPALNARLRQLRDHGQPQRYVHQRLGFNYRMDGIQGAVLNVKLRYLDAWNAQRRELARLYGSRLGAIDALKLPGEAEGAESVWHLYVIQDDERDRLRQKLEAEGIQTGLHYPVPVHRQQALQGYGVAGEALPVTERIARQCLSLPLHPGPTMNETVSRIAEVIRRIKEA